MDESKSKHSIGVIAITNNSSEARRLQAVSDEIETAEWHRRENESISRTHPHFWTKD